MYLAGKTGKGDRTNQYSDWGGELGGPILKDRWWFWGAYGDNDIRILKLNNTSDRTVLKDASFKTQSQLTNAMRASFTYWYANKQKWGRGASATRVQAATTDQSGPNKLAKGELNYVGNNLFLTGRYAHLISGFQLVPEGGMGVSAFIDDSKVNRGSTSFYKSDRPQDVVMADGNWFRGKTTSSSSGSRGGRRQAARAVCREASGEVPPNRLAGRPCAPAELRHGGQQPLDRAAVVCPRIEYSGGPGLSGSALRPLERRSRRTAVALVSGSRPPPACRRPWR